MGTSTNAILAYGFDLGVEDTEELPESLLADGLIDDEDGFEFDTVAARMAGIEPPHVEYEGNENTWDRYWDKKSAAAEKCPVDLIMHCSCDCPMYFLAIRGTEVLAHRGHPKEVSMPAINPEHLQALRNFCQKYGIEWKKPSWQIFSMWC